MNRTIPLVRMMRLAGASVLWMVLLIAEPVAAQVPPFCTTYKDVSGTFSSDAQLIGATTVTGFPRTGLFVQCLTASCVFALNLQGNTASLTAAGNVVVNGQYGFFNAASFGFVPQGAVRIIASGSSVITAFACPN